MSAEVFEVTRHTPYSDLPEWLTVSEVATFLGWNVWTVRKYCNEGLMPCRRDGKKSVRVPKEYLHPNRAQQQVTA